LRERKECIPVLVKQFISDLNKEAGFRTGDSKPKHVSGIEPTAIQVLLAQNWKRNNVRELKNIISSAWINASRNIITNEDLVGRMGFFQGLYTEEFSKKDTPWNMVRKYTNKLREREQTNAVLWANIMSGGNIREAALLLGLADNPDSSRVRLHHFIKKHNLQELIDQKSKEIVYDCQQRAEGDPEKGSELLSQKLSELFPYIPEPDMNAKRFTQIVRKFKLTT
jgi:DNA-binding NtrC family response regulator